MQKALQRTKDTASFIIETELGGANVGRVYEYHICPEYFTFMDLQIKVYYIYRYHICSYTYTYIYIIDIQTWL